MRLLHSTLGFAAHLGGARARRDAGLLATSVAVLATAILLSVALPQLAADAVDRGAQQTVAEVGRAADIEVRAEVGTPGGQSARVAPATMAALANEILGRLPAPLDELYTSSALTIVGPPVTARPNGAESLPRLTVQLAYVQGDAATVRLESGRLPDSGEGLEVALAAAVAEAAGLRLGDELVLSEATSAVIVGIVAADDPSHAVWSDSPQLWAPNATATAVSFSALTDLTGIAAAEGLVAAPVTATVRLMPDASRFSSATVASAVAEISVLRVSPSTLAGATGAQLDVRSSLDTATDDFPIRARSAVAQMLILSSGVLGVACAVVLLVTRVVVLRRSAEVALERARGASLAAVVVRSLLESILLAAVAAAIGLGAAAALTDQSAMGLAVVIVIAVGVLAAPVQTALLVRRADRSARRVAANRGDRREVERRAATRRLVVEGFVLVVAGAALFAARSRGLLQSRTDDVDPLLSATPLLVAVAVAVVVLRVYPFVVRLGASLGRRTKGALGTLGAMQAERAVSPLPLAALTLAVALVVSGGLLVETVRTGQVDAAWQRTGAELRLEGSLSSEQVDAVAAAPGVTAASGLLVVHETKVAVGAQSLYATLVAVDESYGEVLRQLPEVAGVAGAASIDSLFAEVGDDEPLPMLIDASLAKKLDEKVVLTVAGETREVFDAQVVGELETGMGGYDRGPFIYVSKATLGQRVSFSVDATRLLVMGPGAEAATAELAAIQQSRAQWLDERQSQALVSGVATVMLASTAAVALLALIALVATVLVGSRDRRRSLSLLRTLGVSPRLGWWLALSELAPMVIAALVGGVLSAVAVILVLGPSFGLETLAGGVEPPRLTIAPWVIAAVAIGAAALALLAMLVEVVSHRRDRLSEVLRVGDSL
jgi:putative ABC transport system permease protein